MTKVTDVRVYRWWPDTLGWTRLPEWTCTVVGTASLTCCPLEIPRRLESWVPIPPPIPLGLLAERSGTSLASKTFTSAQAVIMLSTNKELLQWNLDLGVFFFILRIVSSEGSRVQCLTHMTSYQDQSNGVVPLGLSKRSLEKSFSLCGF